MTSPIKRISHHLLAHRTWISLGGLVALAAIAVSLRPAPEPIEPAERPAEASPVREEARSEPVLPLRMETEIPAAPTRSPEAEPVIAADASETAPQAAQEEAPRSFADLADPASAQPSQLFAFANQKTGITAFPPMPLPTASVETPEPARVVAQAER